MFRIRPVYGTRGIDCIVFFAGFVYLYQIGTVQFGRIVVVVAHEHGDLIDINVSRAFAFVSRIRRIEIVAVGIRYEFEQIERLCTSLNVLFLAVRSYAEHRYIGTYIRFERRSYIIHGKMYGKHLRFRVLYRVAELELTCSYRTAYRRTACKLDLLKRSYRVFVCTVICRYGENLSVLISYSGCYITGTVHKAFGIPGITQHVLIHRYIRIVDDIRNVERKRLIEFQIGFEHITVYIRESQCITQTVGIQTLESAFARITYRFVGGRLRNKLALAAVRTYLNDTGLRYLGHVVFDVHGNNGIRKPVFIGHCSGFVGCVGGIDMHVDLACRCREPVGARRTGKHLTVYGDRYFKAVVGTLCSNGKNIALALYIAFVYGTLRFKALIGNGLLTGIVITHIPVVEQTELVVIGVIKLPCKRVACGTSEFEEVGFARFGVFAGADQGITGVVRRVFHRRKLGVFDRNAHDRSLHGHGRLSRIGIKIMFGQFDIQHYWINYSCRRIGYEHKRFTVVGHRKRKELIYVRFYSAASLFYRRTAYPVQQSVFFIRRKRRIVERYRSKSFAVLFEQRIDRNVVKRRRRVDIGIDEQSVVSALHYLHGLRHIGIAVIIGELRKTHQFDRFGLTLLDSGSDGCRVDSYFDAYRIRNRAVSVYHAEPDRCDLSGSAYKVFRSELNVLGYTVGIGYRFRAQYGSTRRRIHRKHGTVHVLVYGQAVLVVEIYIGHKSAQREFSRLRIAKRNACLESIWYYRIVLVLNDGQARRQSRCFRSRRSRQNVDPYFGSRIFAFAVHKRNGKRRRPCAGCRHLNRHYGRYGIIFARKLRTERFDFYIIPVA